MHKLRDILERKSAGYICLWIAILGRIGIQRVFLNIEHDKSALLQTTKNFIAGHGFSIQRIPYTDLAVQSFVPYIGWPPGYPLLLSPFLALFPDNFMLAAFCVDMLSTIIFFLFLQKILRQLGFSTWSSNIFLLIQGFFLHEYLYTSHPTDFPALSLIVAGWYYLNKIARSQANRIDFACCIFFFGFASLVRYQYMPVCVFAATWLLYAGWKHKKPAYIRSFFVVSASLLVITGAVLVYQKLISGHFTFQTPGAIPGFHPENLLFLNPFAFTAFIEQDFFCIQISRLTGIPYLSITVVLRIISAIMLLCFCWYAWQWFHHKATRIIDTENSSWVIGFLLSLGTVATLIALSITHSKIEGHGSWTFIMDTRYFAFPAVFIQLFAWNRIAGLSFSPKWGRHAARFIGVILLFGALHGGYVLANKLKNGVTPFKSILTRQIEMATMLEFINQQKKKDTSRIIIVSGYDNQVGYFANWYGAKGLFLESGYLTKPVRTSKPVTVLFVVPKEFYPYFSDFLDRIKASLYREDARWYYYTADILPTAK